MHSVPNIKSSDAVPDHQDQIDPEPNNLLLLSVSTIQSLRLSWTPSPFEALLNQFLTPTRGFDSPAGGQICRSLDEPCVNVSAFMLLTRLSTALPDTKCWQSQSRFSSTERIQFQHRTLESKLLVHRRTTHD